MSSWLSNSLFRGILLGILAITLATHIWHRYGERTAKHRRALSFASRTDPERKHPVYPQGMGAIRIVSSQVSVAQAPDDDSTGQRDVFIYEVPSGATRRLTGHKSARRSFGNFVGGTALSPDGKRVAFLANSADQPMPMDYSGAGYLRPMQIWVLDIGTGKMTRLGPLVGPTPTRIYADGAGEFDRIAWSPDGRLLACRAQTGVRSPEHAGRWAWEVWNVNKRRLISYDGRNVRRAAEEWAGWRASSPSGSWAAFAPGIPPTPTQPRLSVDILPQKAREKSRRVQVRLPDPNIVDFMLLWSRDERQLVIAVEQLEAQKSWTKVYLVNPKLGTVSSLVRLRGPLNRIGWSRNCQWLIVLHGLDLFLWNADTGKQQSLFGPSAASVEAADWAEL